MNRLLNNAVSSSLVALIAFLWSGTVYAEISTSISLNQKVSEADEILHARCLSARTSWRNGLVVTTSMFQVVEDLQNRGTTSIELVSAGGTAVHPTLKVPVTTRLSNGVEVRPNDEVIMFVKQDEVGEFRLVAGEQTYMRVVSTPVGDRLVKADERRVQAKPAADGAQSNGAKGTDLTAETYSIDELKSRIRQQINQVKKDGGIQR